MEAGNVEPLSTSSGEDVSGLLSDLVFDGTSKLTTLLQSVTTHTSKRAILSLLRSVLL